MGTPRQPKKDGALKAAQDVAELKDYVIFLQMGVNPSSCILTRN